MREKVGKFQEKELPTVSFEPKFRSEGIACKDVCDALERGVIKPSDIVVDFIGHEYIKLNIQGKVDIVIWFDYTRWLRSIK